jgi:hypothetical protein
MVGSGVPIGCVVVCRWIDRRRWGGHQLPGARAVAEVARLVTLPDAPAGSRIVERAVNARIMMAPIAKKTHNTRLAGKPRGIAFALRPGDDLGHPNKAEAELSLDLLHVLRQGAPPCMREVGARCENLENVTTSPGRGKGGGLACSAVRAAESAKATSPRFRARCCLLFCLLSRADAAEIET